MFVLSLHHHIIRIKYSNVVIQTHTSQRSSEADAAAAVGASNATDVIAAGTAELLTGGF